MSSPTFSEISVPGRSLIRSTVLLASSLFVSISTFAQESVEIAGEDVGTWFSRNWMWVTGAVLLLLLILAFSGRKRKVTKTTTVVKDSYGNVKSVTTTEEKP